MGEGFLLLQRLGRGCVERGALMACVGTQSGRVSVWADDVKERFWGEYSPAWRGADKRQGPGCGQTDMNGPLIWTIGRQPGASVPRGFPKSQITGADLFLEEDVRKELGQK